ncbi:hypothetical protein SAMN05421780_104286 [Flexibacter flexilis DSM 6793]|uniref:Uncharacterized protein n=1 Tax=Flexibacter flexilis DSM 6793 TaxID=927664 RepID=A0A1I1IA94_9BACT|nr:hypothetical protein [Flexibacter flexilis]SFC33166.1 hypothetical protein SAMN05421780_104286 [Flexibacter flexilis DSM 6793]
MTDESMLNMLGVLQQVSGVYKRIADDSKSNDDIGLRLKCLEIAASANGVSNKVHEAQIMYNWIVKAREKKAIAQNAPTSDEEFPDLKIKRLPVSYSDAIGEAQSLRNALVGLKNDSHNAFSALIQTIEQVASDREKDSGLEQNQIDWLVREIESIKKQIIESADNFLEKVADE